MDVISSSIDFIETHLGESFSLEAVAAAAGVSRFYLSRAFVASTGMTTFGYARARRLSEAAKALAGGAPDILHVALDWGYESHEAFSRAFRSRFAMSPNEVRERGSLAGLTLQTALTTNAAQVALEAPRFVAAAPIRLAGLVGRFTPDTAPDVASLWRRLTADASWISTAPAEAFGACLSWEESAESFDYLCAFQIGSAAPVPQGLTSVDFPAQTYATFWRPENISCVGDLLTAIFGDWLPRAGCQLGAAPIYLARFDRRFDPVSGNGGFEIAIPIAT